MSPLSLKGPAGAVAAAHGSCPHCELALGHPGGLCSHPGCPSVHLQSDPGAQGLGRMISSLWCSWSLPTEQCGLSQPPGAGEPPASDTSTPLRTALAPLLGTFLGLGSVFGGESGRRLGVTLSSTLLGWAEGSLPSVFHFHHCHAVFLAAPCRPWKFSRCFLSISHTFKGGRGGVLKTLFDLIHPHSCGSRTSLGLGARGDSRDVPCNHLKAGSGQLDLLAPGQPGRATGYASLSSLLTSHGQGLGVSEDFPH